MDLFDLRKEPLARRMQPETLEEFVGQRHLLDEGKILRKLIDEDRVISSVFYGPPGTGKTALARIIARKTSSSFIYINAVISGLKDIRDAIEKSKNGKTIVFIDEIHRFNKLQQDALLPSVESGEIILIGASTHNPFFAIIPALSSRLMLFEFYPLTDDEMIIILRRALTDKRGLGSYMVRCPEDVIKKIAQLSGGDARRALNTLELAFLISDEKDGSRIITSEHVIEALQKRSLYYDEEEHYNTISAFIKSMRGSDPDATVYYLAKMIASGEDPLFIARRIVICASEDVGNADPMALVIATEAMNAIEKIGMPEGRIILSQAALYVAQAPKSNASYLAIESAMEEIQRGSTVSIPQHLKDAHYSAAERLGRGKGYLYPHDYDEHYVKQDYMDVKKVFYIPSSQGFERIIKKRMEKRRLKNGS